MMRSFQLGLLLLVGSLPAPASAQQPAAPTTAYVYKPDGTRHCEAEGGISLDSMAAELARSHIRVYAQRKSHDGREGVAVCGEPTGSINVFEIAASGVSRAVRLGFRPLDPDWLEAR